MNDPRKTDISFGAAPALMLRAAIALAAMLALSAAADRFSIPYPGMLLCLGLTALTARFGIAAGVAGGAAMAGYVALRHPGPENLYALAVLMLGAAANVAVVGGLKRRRDRALRRLDEADAALRDDARVPCESGATDTLTGVGSRGAIRQNYPRYRSRFLHVMLLDLDDYRQTNDTYGHAVGDYILRKVGASLAEVFGPEACYRFGGDAFLVICDDADPAAFPARVDRLRQALGDIALDDKRLPVRFSAGSVYGDCERSDDLRLMMHQADRNLRQAQAAGGGQLIDTGYSRR